MVPNPGCVFQRLNPLAATAVEAEFQRRVEAEFPGVEWSIIERIETGSGPTLTAIGTSALGLVAVSRSLDGPVDVSAQ